MKNHLSCNYYTPSSITKSRLEEKIIDWMSEFDSKKQFSIRQKYPRLQVKILDSEKSCPLYVSPVEFLFLDRNDCT